MHSYSKEYLICGKDKGKRDDWVVIGMRGWLVDEMVVFYPYCGELIEHL